MRVNRSFDWLGRFPLAIDLADTVRFVRDSRVELLTDETSLSIWIDAELPRFPDADAARGRLPAVLVLRDAVRVVLTAHSDGDAVPPGPLGILNEASARAPSYTTVNERGQRVTVEVNEDRFQVFAAQVARSTFDVLEQSPSTVAVCRAPSCGMFFVPGDGRQRWCSPGCGNRARVARHAARTTRRHPE